MTNKQKAHNISIRLMADGLREKNGYSQRKAIENALVEMANWKDEQHKLELDAKDESIIQTDMDWKAVYDAEVVRNAKVEDALRLGEPNDITIKDIVLKIQSMCKFYSQKGCQKGNNFGGLCENCPVFKFR